MSKILNHLIKDIEIEYSHHPRLFWIVFISITCLFFIIQSYFAMPRDLSILFVDSLLPLLILFTTVFIFIKPRNNYLLIFGLFYILLTVVVYFIDTISKPYGTFFFLYGFWLLVDWYNYYKFKKSLFSELVRGNYYLAFGVFISTFVFAIVTEYVNLPFLIWEYNIPFPFLEVYGIPALVAAFGWLPWTLSILAIFYHFVLLNEKKFK